MTSVELFKARQDEANCRRNLARLEADLASVKYALAGRGDVSATARDLQLTSGLKDPDGDRLALERKKISLVSAIEILGVRIGDVADSVRALEAVEHERETEQRAAAEKAVTLGKQLEDETLAVHAALKTLAAASGRMRAAYVALLGVEYPPTKLDATGEPERENFAPTTYARFAADVSVAFSKMVAGSMFSDGFVRPTEGHDFEFLAVRWSGSVRHKADTVLNPKPAKQPDQAAA